MKVKNLEVGIRIGNKQRKFTNLILNNYLDLFANSFKEFASKELTHCVVNITKTNTKIDETSTTMNFNTLIEGTMQEVLTDNSILNKYSYTEKQTAYNYNPISSYKGQTIKEIGFGMYDYNLNAFVMYAYINVSKYNIVIQEKQPVIISRIDKIVSDMEFWSNSTKIKTPYHLTGDGIHEILGMEYERIFPKLYSLGFGILPYKYLKEYLVENLNISKTGIGEITIDNNFQNFANNSLYPSKTLYPNKKLYPQKATANLLMYKFKMYRETFPDPEGPPVLIDTGLFYVQYKKLERFGVINNLKIKYERS